MTWDVWKDYNADQDRKQKQKRQVALKLDPEERAQLEKLIHAYVALEHGRLSPKSRKTKRLCFSFAAGKLDRMWSEGTAKLMNFRGQLFVVSKKRYLIEVTEVTGEHRLCA